MSSLAELVFYLYREETICLFRETISQDPDLSYILADKNFK
jgi:hypothetical protein